MTVTDFGELQSTAICFVYVTNEGRADNVTITSVRYVQKLVRIVIKALSDAPAGSVTLTAWANYGMETIKLGNLKYSNKNKVYSNTFKKLSSAPGTVTVTSSGGGSDTK